MSKSNTSLPETLRATPQAAIIFTYDENPSTLDRLVHGADTLEDNTIERGKRLLTWVARRPRRPVRLSGYTLPDRDSRSLVKMLVLAPYQAGVTEVTHHCTASYDILSSFNYNTHVDMPTWARALKNCVVNREIQERLDEAFDGATADTPLNAYLVGSEQYEELERACRESGFKIDTVSRIVDHNEAGSSSALTSLQSRGSSSFWSLRREVYDGIIQDVQDSLYTKETRAELHAALHPTAAEALFSIEPPTSARGEREE